MKQEKHRKEHGEIQFQNTKDSLNKEVKIRTFINSLTFNNHLFGIFYQILQLQKELKDQFIIRKELEKATVNQPHLHDPINQDLLPKVKKKLILRIYLSKIHSFKIGSPANQPVKDLIKEISILEFEVKHLEEHLLSMYRKAFQEYINPSPKKSIEDSHVLRSHSSLSLRAKALEKTVHEALESYHSLPLAMLEVT